MTTSNFMIGPIKDALRKDVKPFATPEDSFTTLTNAVQFRGRISRRSGYTKLGRLANGTPVMGLRTYENFGIGLQTLVAFDTTLAYEWNGATFITLPSVMPVIWSGTDSDFFYTVNYAGAFWATNNNPGLNGWLVTNFAGSAGVGNAATVNVTSAGNGVVLDDYVYFVNLSDDVSGNAAVLAQVTAAGDPTFTVTAVLQPASSTFAWEDGITTTGMVIDSMQTVPGQDGIRYYGILSNGTGWANYNPPIDINTVLAGALLIFPYRGYLVFLNTWEGADGAGNVKNYGNRARWTQIGTPYYSPPAPKEPNIQGTDINTARDDLFGRGGANDAPTNESIVAAGFIRDILVVYFERSTWRLRFVNNAQNPFVWERVNIELGSECTFSAIPFDKGLMAIGNRGIVISDGNDTSRFDEKIPDDVFNIRLTNEGLQRVYGIRTFRTKFNYWTYPSDENQNSIYPDRVLVFNYDTKNWSYFDDAFTCFGYFYPLTGEVITWGNLTEAWADLGNVSWDSSLAEIGIERIVAGNQQGYVLELQELTEGDYCINDPSLSITAINNTGAIFTSPNSYLKNNTWITLSGVTGTTTTDGVSVNGRNFKVFNQTYDPNDFTLYEFKSIDGGAAAGGSYAYTINYQTLIAGSIQINIGALVFTDPNVNGVLVEASLMGTGTIDYGSGLINLTFTPPIASTEVYIRIVSLDPTQGLAQIETEGIYGGGGEIAIISNINIVTKLFNFFNDDQRSRLSKIDFYVQRTAAGQFQCNVFGDDSNVIINNPLSDNPQSNIVLTSVNPYQISDGDTTIFRLFCDAIAQTVQLQMTMSDAQMATNPINKADIEIQSMIFSLRRGGRLV